ncbi:hypothetical protein LTR04_003421 [Oleoguttula sp. CCFEE 6159]|nr:hypothetical protein LTR04_003421 [Oleoguttula sp. CCFEE 6159]
MADHKDYLLKVTAGPSYDPKTHEPVHVNTEKPIKISTPHIDANVRVRIQEYRGLPRPSPTTSPYFSQPPHTADRYSISFTFTPKTTLNGHDVVFGNDFDHPIRDRLPPGFGQAFKIAKWFIDPGLYGDVNADESYLYGPLLSSINVLRVGEKGQVVEAAEKVGRKVEDGGDEVVVFEEGADGEGKEAREKWNVPGDAAARKKHFLTEAHLKGFEFEEGRAYQCDFFNPYLDFNEFALKLPGFALVPGITVPIIRYWDGQPLRYALKNRATDELLFVLVFTLVPADNAAQEEQNTAQGTATNDRKDGSKAPKPSASAQAPPDDDLN